MNARVEIDGKTASPVTVARLLAKRLENLGINPYQSENDRYLVLLEDAPGEVIEMGRPLKGTRFFKSEALKRDVQTVRDIEVFAREAGASDWLFWNVGLTGAKASVDGLCEAMTDFNRRINIDFSELRKKHGFELILIAIHPRYDAVSGQFDLHAHFICRIPPEQREAARRRLMSKFSKVDLPDDMVRNPAACSTYMLWGIYDPKELLTWPDRPLMAAWELAQSRARLVRTGGGFALWKRSRHDPAQEASAREERARRRANREATKDPRKGQLSGDRFLAKIVARIRGKMVRAALWQSGKAVLGQRPDNYTSAACGITQDQTAKPSKTPKKSAFTLVWRTVRLQLQDFGCKVSKQCGPHLRAVSGALMRWREEALERLRRSFFRLRDRTRE
ncbi:hypothetical protein [Pannonibacter sp. SL95]|uniref:hypothetical protein n=1 Tax=Pannonibacter sp. SL95 TaxID=2995153 RepID=UPI0022744F66|nr:hypothetical protein [Pannonibacter sp. SL95]MCY1705267.1 hypothetical protein [Pannonibacter sp. SL95]